jgi:hypothetical protein
MDRSQNHFTLNRTPINKPNTFINDYYNPTIITKEKTEFKNQQQVYMQKMQEDRQMHSLTNKNKPTEPLHYPNHSNQKISTKLNSSNNIQNLPSINDFNIVYSTINFDSSLINNGQSDNKINNDNQDLLKRQLNESYKRILNEKTSLINKF